MKIKLNYAFTEAKADFDIEVSTEDLKVLTGSAVAEIVAKMKANQSSFTQKIAAIRGMAQAAQDNSEIIDEVFEEGGGPDLSVLHFDRNEEKAEEPAEEGYTHRPDYITIDQWNQTDLPPEYGDNGTIIFRRPTEKELIDAHAWFYCFLMDWCLGWVEDSNTRLFWQQNDRMEYLRNAITHEQAALKLKWLFWSEGSMQNAVEQGLKSFTQTALTERFGPLNHGVTTNMVVQVSGHLLQVCSREIPELSVFFDHQWELKHTHTGEEDE
jgi:hypothetical protein